MLHHLDIEVFTHSQVCIPLNCLDFLLVRFLLKHKANGGPVPDLFEDLVVQASFVGAVVPLSKTATAV